MATLDENAMIDLIPVENDERMTDGNEEVKSRWIQCAEFNARNFQNLLEKRRESNDRQELCSFFLQKRMNKITFGRTISKCLITTDLNYLKNFDLKLFLRQVPKLRHYKGPKTWRNLRWRNFGETTV